jgi:hypothetical protein
LNQKEQKGMPIGEALKAQVLEYQTNEITEHHIYRRLAESMREPENARLARDEPFRRRFLEMAGLSLGVAGLSFLVGFLVRTVLGVDV